MGANRSWRLSQRGCDRASSSAAPTELGLFVVHVRARDTAIVQFLSDSTDEQWRAGQVDLAGLKILHLVEERKHRTKIFLRYERSEPEQRLVKSVFDDTSR